MLTGIVLATAVSGTGPSASMPGKRKSGEPLLPLGQGDENGRDESVVSDAGTSL